MVEASPYASEKPIDLSNTCLKKGCLLEPVSVAVRLMDKVGMKFGQRVCICGGGPIGLLALQAIAKYGAAELTLIEPIEARRELARKYGAKYVIDPMADDSVKKGLELTDGRGYDVVIDCSGSPKAAYPLPQLCARGGKLIYAAMYPNDWEMPLNIYKYCYYNELEITGMYVSPYAYPRAAQMLQEFDLDAFTEKVFEIDQAEEAFAAQVTGKYTKILIRCNQIDGE